MKENSKFEVTLPERTTRSIELTIKAIDEQVEELQSEVARLQSLRAHMARTIGANRVPTTRIESLVDSVDRRMKEGDTASIEAELAAETEAALAEESDDLRPASLAAVAATETRMKPPVKQ